MSEIAFIHPGWSVRPVAGRIGAEITGLRLAGKLPRATVDGIRRALDYYKVLFFRGQDHLDDTEQEAFARNFGDIVGHPTIPARAGTEAILELDASRGGGRANPAPHGAEYAFADCWTARPLYAARRLHLRYLWRGR